IDRVIPVPHNTNADLGDQRRTDNVRIIESGALIAGWPAALKAAVVRAAVDAAVGSIETRIKYCGPLETVARKHPVARADHVVDLHIELVDGLALRSRPFEIGI